MCDNHVHRVYICKEGSKGQEVVGVVTPTDILSLIAGQGGWLRRTLSLRANSTKRQASTPAAAGGAAGGAAAAAALDEAIAVATAAVAAVDGEGAGEGCKKARVDAE